MNQINILVWVVAFLSILVNSCAAQQTFSDCNALKKKGFLNLNESEEVGSVIFSVNTTLLKIGTRGGYFNVETSNISHDLQNVVLKKKIDREVIARIEVSFLCTKTNNFTFQILVNDINDNPLVFNEDLYTVNISEAKQNGSVVFSFKNKATDKDYSATEVSYQIVSGSKGYFKIEDRRSEDVILIKPLDYETDHRQFTLNVSGESSSTERKNNDHSINFTTLIINVIDVDDQNPKFKDTIYRLSVPEEKYNGSKKFQTIPPISAADEDDINAQIQYSVDQSTEVVYPSLFSIDQDTAQVSINGYLQSGTYYVNIKAYQKDRPMDRFTIAVLIVNVTENIENIEAPVLVNTSYEVNISEDAPIGSFVLLVQTLNQNRDSELNYELQNEPSGTFQIKEKTAAITLAKTLDREQLGQYQFEVIVIRKLDNKTANSSVTVHVLDVNDNSPVFSALDSYSFSANRTNPVNTVIGEVTATDKDKSSNGKVTYSLLGPSEIISIHPETGNISIKNNLNISNVGSYGYVVLAQDQGTPKRVTPKEITVEILNVNTNTPVFETDLYIFTLSEAAQVGSFVGKVAASDPDSPSLQFSLSNPYLNIDRITGDIHLQKVYDLDKSLPQELLIRVRVSDSKFHTFTNVSVTFQYANEFTPIITSKNSVFVQENETKNAKLLQVEGQDFDQNETLTYTILEQSNTPFSIEPKTGWIYLNCDHCLDDFKQSIYEIPVHVEDDGDPPRQNITVITIHVENTITSAPTFLLKTFRATIQENQKPQHLLKLLAVDKDTAPEDLVYTLDSTQPANASQYVNVTTTGSVSTTKRLDAEIFTKIILNVLVSDSESHDLAQVIVDVQDVNEYAPVLTFSEKYLTLMENTTVGEIIATAKASDRDISNSGFTFWLGTGSDGKFEIDYKTGNISLSQAFDRKEKHKYVINVFVSDHSSKPRITSGQLFINVSDSNNPPIIQSQHIGNITVREDLAVGSTILNFLVLDSDIKSSGLVSVTISNGNDNDFFRVKKLSNNDWIIVLNKKLDYETKNEYSLSLKAEDNSYEPKYFIENVTIFVENVLESPKLVFPISQASVTPILYCKENDTKSVSLEVEKIASDGEGNVSYTLMNYKSFFILDETSGVFKTTQEILPHGVYILKINSCSSLTNEAPMCSNFSLTVVIHQPKQIFFCPSSYSIDISEGTLKNTDILQLVLYPHDLSNVYFQIETGGNSNLFSINETGMLSTFGELDREKHSQHSFTVRAVNNKTQYETQAQVTIYVQDENDNNPVLITQQLTVSVFENTTRSNIIKITAEDVDTGANAEISYSLFNSSDAFTIDKNSGEISVVKSLHRDKGNTVLVFVKATDKGKPPRSTTTQVTVHVIDVNDHEPDFLQPEYSTLVLLPNSISKTVITVRAKDADEGTNAEIFYSISENDHHNPFIIDCRNGEIQATQELELGSYLFTVVATDLGVPPLSSSVNVNITAVANGTVTVPEIFLSTDNLYLFLGMTNETELNLTITTENVDKPVGISGGNDEDYFRLSDAGKLEINKQLNKAKTFLLTLQAVSQSGLPTTKELTITVVKLKFDQSTYFLQIQENKRTTNDLIDFGCNGENFNIPVFYFFKPDTQLFLIDPQTGIIKQNATFDREQKPLYTLTLFVSLNKAHNQEETIFEDSAELIVQVLDINDNAPSFGVSGDPLHFTIPQDVKARYVVAKLEAFDKDELENSKVLYQISEGDKTFSVGPHSGILSVLDPTAVHSGTNLTVVVSATDQDGNGQSTHINIMINVEQLDGDKFLILVAPITLEIYNDNQDELKRKLVNLFGVDINITSAKVHTDGKVSDPTKTDLFITLAELNSTISFQEFKRLVPTKQKEITSLFESYKKEESHGKENEEFTAASIALIVVAGVMFVASLIAVIIVCRLWRKQKDYQDREESAAKARKRLEALTEENGKKNSSFQSDPDDPLEMKDISPTVSEDLSSSNLNSLRRTSQDERNVYQDVISTDSQTNKTTDRLPDVGAQYDNVAERREITFPVHGITETTFDDNEESLKYTSQNGVIKSANKENTQSKHNKSERRVSFKEAEIPDDSEIQKPTETENMGDEYALICKESDHDGSRYEVRYPKHKYVNVKKSDSPNEETDIEDTKYEPVYYEIREQNPKDNFDEDSTYL